MLTVRIGPLDDPHTLLLANDTAAHIRAHPVAPGLAGLVIIGAGGVGTHRPGDPTPRVIVPLPGPHPLNALAREHIARAHAVVLRDRAEAARLAALIDDGVAVLADAGRGGARPFLRDARPGQTVDAWDAVDGNPALCDALEQAGCTRPDGLQAEAHHLAAAAIEAVVACLDDRGATLAARTRG
jgi:hypothetical protein